MKFKAIYAEGKNWPEIAKTCLTALGPLVPGFYNLGFIFAHEALAGEVSSIIAFLRGSTGVPFWSGGIASRIWANGWESSTTPGVAIMVASVPRDYFELMALKDKPDWDKLNQDWAFGLLQIGLGRQNIARILEVADKRAMLPLCGGFVNSAITNQVGEKDISALFVSGKMPVMTGLAQSFFPLSGSYKITDCENNILYRLNNVPAVDIMIKAGGGETSLKERAGQIQAAVPVKGSDSGDYMVRDILTVDISNGCLSLAQPLNEGDEIIFVERSKEKAVAALARMAERIKTRLGENIPHAGIYISSLSRNHGLFENSSEELAIIHRILGDFPLIGYATRGEINFNRTYSHTGLLILFA